MHGRKPGGHPTTLLARVLAMVMGAGTAHLTTSGWLLFSLLYDQCCSHGARAVTGHGSENSAISVTSGRTSGKCSRYESCELCLDTLKELRVLSGVTQKNRDRNATCSLNQQRFIKATLQGMAGFEEYEAECDAANPPKKASRICCTQKEMEETLPLVGHGLVECILSHCFS